MMLMHPKSELLQSLGKVIVKRKLLFFALASCCLAETDLGAMQLSYSN